MTRWQRRVVFGTLALVLATAGAFLWPESGSSPTAVFRNMTEGNVTLVHEKQDRGKAYLGQKERAEVPPGGFAPFMYAHGDVFLAGYSDEPVSRDNPSAVSLVPSGKENEYIEIRAMEDDALVFVTGLEFPQLSDITD